MTETDTAEALPGHRMLDLTLGGQGEPAKKARLWSGEGRGRGSATGEENSDGEWRRSLPWSEVTHGRGVRASE